MRVADPQENIMGGPSRTTFAKRTRERARQEKAREKAERRLQRKEEKATTGVAGGPPIEEGNEMLLPEEYNLPDVN
jgi:hypothetical protein